MICANAGLDGGTRPTDVCVDHIGVVVHDLEREIALWRNLGFTVSDAVPLMGCDSQGRPMPLGQSSAHIVFENAYVELSSPELGSGNHLEPYLAKGEGVRILVLAAADAAKAQLQVATHWPQTSDVKASSRAILVDGAERTAKFLWFPLPVDIAPSVLSAVVQHLTPELVFHPSLRSHANGARRVTQFVATGPSAALRPPRNLVPCSENAPRLNLRDSESTFVIDGFEVSGTPGGGQRFFSL